MAKEKLVTLDNLDTESFVVDTVAKKIKVKPTGSVDESKLIQLRSQNGKAVLGYIFPPKNGDNTRKLPISMSEVMDMVDVIDAQTGSTTSFRSMYNTASFNSGYGVSVTRTGGVDVVSNSGLSGTGKYPVLVEIDSPNKQVWILFKYVGGRRTDNAIIAVHNGPLADAVSVSGNPFNPEINESSAHLPPGISGHKGLYGRISGAGFWTMHNDESIVNGQNTIAQAGLDAFNTFIGAV